MQGISSFLSEGNGSYQRDLADALVADLGLDGAIDFCQTNEWQGALNVLLSRRTAIAKDPSFGRRPVA